MPTDEEIAVLAANDAFYDAFEAEDAGKMEILWAADAPCACVHPGWDPVVGRQEVLETWHGILGGGRAPHVKIDSARVLVYGNVALVVCIEHVTAREGPGSALLSATNVFVREHGHWRMTHHHASPLSQDHQEPEKSIPPSRLN